MSFDADWTDTKVVEDRSENVTKYVFSKLDAVAEAVLYRYPTYAERTVICCSTQSGCPVGCRFCGAGDSFVRSLSADEIVSQPARLLDDVYLMSGTRPQDMGRLQIMFMSMGEPLLNLKGLVPTLADLYQRYPSAALLISTIGPRVDYGMVRTVSQDIPTIGLQFSIHKSTDGERNDLIPFRAKLSLQEIALEGEAWHNATGRKPFFNYCAGDDNSSAADADRLYEMFNPDIWCATISVICERSEGLPATSNHQRRLATDFEGLLSDRGFDTRTFDPAGQDTIGGGCGQLWFVQDWMRRHPELARPSIGRGRPSVHAPLIAP